MNDYLFIYIHGFGIYYLSGSIIYADFIALKKFFFFLHAYKFSTLLMFILKWEMDRSRVGNGVILMEWGSILHRLVGLALSEELAFEQKVE